MKLRNKMTGEIVENFDGFTTFTNDWSSAKNLQYTSLAKLNDDWEDYKPAEPLIKDEKIRKAVRAWAEANDFKKVRYRSYSSASVFCDEFHSVECATTIEFGWIMGVLKPGIYTIAELCGEEEE